MGCGNSPSIAGRLGACFLRRLAEQHPEIFSGTPMANTWKDQVATGRYDSRLNHGRNLIGGDGLPAVIGVDFMDNFLFCMDRRTTKQIAVRHFLWITPSKLDSFAIQ
jgi:hypothetical protein